MEENQNSADYTRRSFLETGSIGAIDISGFWIWLDRFLNLRDLFDIVESNKYHAKTLLDKVIYKPNPSEYFRDLFYPQLQSHLLPATNNADNRQLIDLNNFRTYSNEQVAIQGILRSHQTAIPKAANEKLIQEFRHDASTIFLGGNGSNVGSGKLLGRPEESLEPHTFEFKFMDMNRNVRSCFAKLPYTMRMSENLNKVQTIRDGSLQLLSHSRQIIFDRNKNIVAESQGALKSEISLLTRDYLLYTKICAPDGSKAEIVSFAGMHGPSMRGIDLLVNELPEEDVRFLYEYLNFHGNQGTGSYQVVFEVSNFFDQYVQGIDAGETTAGKNINICKFRGQYCVQSFKVEAIR